MCLLCDDNDTSYHDDPGHDSFNIPDCTGRDDTCPIDDHTPWFALNADNPWLALDQGSH